MPTWGIYRCMLCAVMCMHVHEEADNNVRVVPQMLSTIILRQCLSIAWNTPCRQSWLTSKPQESSCSLLLTSGIDSTYHHTQLLLYGFHSQSHVLTEQALHQLSHHTSPWSSQTLKNSECKNTRLLSTYDYPGSQRVTEKHWDLIPSDIFTHKIIETKYGIIHYLKHFHVFALFSHSILLTFKNLHHLFSKHSDHIMFYNCTAQAFFQRLYFKIPFN